MNAFLSYSHNDSEDLAMFEKHLSQLKRENKINAWYDGKIGAGGNLEKEISRNLQTSELFIALLSPEYIASNYCYNKEFEKAMEMQKAGELIIVPVILESCDWLNTPFKDFKALPKDGKPIRTWENKNTAYLDVIQNLRKLIENDLSSVESSPTIKRNSHVPTRNYRIKKDFD